MILEVALPLPLFTTFSYTVPEHLSGYAAPGKRVIVPFKKRRLLGLIISIEGEGRDPSTLRPVTAILDRDPVLSPEILKLGLWMAEYYMVPPGQALLATLPGILTRLEEPYYRATAGGMVRIGELEPNARELLQALYSKKRLYLSEIQEKPGWYEASQKMVRDGFLHAHNPEGKKVTVRRLYGLPRTPLETLLERCGRSPKQKDILKLLKEEGRPLTEDEITSWAACSSATISALAKKGLLLISDQQIRLDLRTHHSLPWDGPALYELTGEQKKAFSQIKASIDEELFKVFLLQGITSSGKTEIYLHAIAETVKQGRTALYLVPEIALTFSPARRLRALFDDRVAILHSGLNDRERTQEFERIRRGDVSIVVGPRSALFSPLTGLGLIVVDEEQDGSFKQENSPRYHARDLAVMRGKMENTTVILGTATPSLVSRSNAESGRYTLLELKERYGSSVLPEVTIVDLRKEEPDEEDHGFVILSEPLKKALSSTFDKGKQALLLVTRKGYAPNMICRMCGYSFPCPACDVTHTVHRKWNILLCHYCNHRLPIPGSCPECSGELLESIGIGTEKVAEKFTALFPEIRHAVVDRDSMKKRGRLKEILHLFAQGELKCLIGTQIIAKGHDFPDVTLVGILTADQALHFPDFRASENLFTLLTQVAGRAGRGEHPGSVLIQTSYPAHYAITHAVSQDYNAFFEREIGLRRALQYPPRTSIVILTVAATSGKRAQRQIQELADRIHEHPYAKQLLILGPAPAPLARLKGRYRYQLMLRSTNRSTLHTVVREALGKSLSTTVTVDIDPYSFM